MARKRNPLKSGYSRATLSANIEQLRREGYPVDRASAAAYREGRKAWRMKHPAGPYPAHLKPAKKTAKKKAVKRNPRKSAATVPVNGYLLVVSKGDGKKAPYYWTGSTFDSDIKKAVFYPDQKGAKGEVSHIRDETPKYYAKLMNNGYKFYLSPTTRRVKANPVPLSKRAKIKQAESLFADFTGHVPDRRKTVRLNVPDVALHIGPVDGIMYTTVRDGKTEHYVHEFKGRARPHLAVTPDGQQMVMIGGSFQFTERGFEDR